MDKYYVKRFLDGLTEFEQQLGKQMTNKRQHLKQCEVNITSPQDKCKIGTTLTYTYNGKKMIITDVTDDYTLNLSDDIAITFFKETTKDNVRNIGVFLSVRHMNINVRLVKLEEFSFDLSLLRGLSEQKTITIRDYDEIVAYDKKIKEQEKYFAVIQDNLREVSKLLGEDYMKTIGHVRDFLNSIDKNKQ